MEAIEGRRGKLIVDLTLSLHHIQQTYLKYTLIRATEVNIMLRILNQFLRSQSFYENFITFCVCTFHLTPPRYWVNNYYGKSNQLRGIM